MKYLFHIMATLSCLVSFAQQARSTSWIVAELIKDKTANCQILGNPTLVDSPYGKAVYFNGKDSALFMEQLPLDSLEEFTVEMLFKPDFQAPFEQRLLHIGENRADRMLLEIRAFEDCWYFDAFAVSGTHKKTLVDPMQLHPLGEWYHLAFVVSPNRLISYVNGKVQLEEDFTFQPIKSGQSAIGMRLNRVSWFKGSIYQIKISPKRLSPKDFISH